MTKMDWTKTICCPSCGIEHVEIKQVPYTTDHLDSTVIMKLSCPNCGFKYSDISVSNSHEPKAYNFRIRIPDDLKSKIIRSSTGYIKIPELGIELTPGSFSQSFIMNIESLLNDFEENIKTLVSHCNLGNRIKKDKLLSRLEKAKKGKISFNIILKDSQGCSMIKPHHGGKIRVRKLSLKEINTLRNF